jgi:hydroxymethylpyrimidine pyrophosphatase-like HAD family hydrolase
MELRPLGIVKEIIQETGLDITYNYDDLVFIEHNPFIIQFDDENLKNLNLFFNVDCEQEAAEKLEAQLKNAASQRGFSITTRGKFEMKPKENTEEIDIKFIE